MTLSSCINTILKKSATVNLYVEAMGPTKTTTSHPLKPKPTECQYGIPQNLAIKTALTGLFTAAINFYNKTFCVYTNTTYIISLTVYDKHMYINHSI